MFVGLLFPGEKRRVAVSDPFCHTAKMDMLEGARTLAWLNIVIIICFQTYPALLLGHVVQTSLCEIGDVRDFILRAIHQFSYFSNLIIIGLMLTPFLAFLFFTQYSLKVSSFHAS